MALALTNLTSGSAAAQTGTSASVAFVNSRLYISCLSSHSTSGNVALVTPVTTNGLTWVQVAKTNAAVDQVGIYCAFKDSGVGTGTQAFDSGQANSTRTSWSIQEVTGSAATAANNGSDAFGTPGYEQRTAAQTTISATLGAFADAVNNVAFGALCVAANTAITAEAGYTSLSNVSVAALSMLVEYILGQDTTVTATNASNPVLAAAVELKMASASTVRTELTLTGVG